MEVQQAYAYLTNPLTKVIYDELGVPGLAVYEKNKSTFTELQEEIRGVNSAQRQRDESVTELVPEDAGVQSARDGEALRLI